MQIKNTIENNGQGLRLLTPLKSSARAAAILVGKASSSIRKKKKW